MGTIFDLIRLIVGGIVLYFGADRLVKGSAGLARAFGVKPLIIGLTVIAYGTSTPELAVSTAAILEDSSAIALGNIIGSCIANLGLILGITALIAPPAVDARLIRRELPVLVVSALITPGMLLDGVISKIDALVLIGCAMLFTLYTLFISSAEVSSLDEATDDSPQTQSKTRLSLTSIIGLILLVVGGDLFVEGAKGIALALGMSERLVGLTVVAIGTSLPELVASLVAAARGYSSLAVGNVVGSNIFNIFLILGVVGFVRPIPGDVTALQLDLGFLVGLTVVGVLFMRGQRRLSRLEGALLTLIYICFIALVAIGL